MPRIPIEEKNADGLCRSARGLAPGSAWDALDAGCGGQRIDEVYPEPFRECAMRRPTCYRLKDRGYLREGYFADMVLVDPEGTTPVESLRTWNIYVAGVHSKEKPFRGTICATWVNGQLAFENGEVQPGVRGRVLEFAV
jgi:hypothetical protein